MKITSLGRRCFVKAAIASGAAASFNSLSAGSAIAQVLGRSPLRVRRSATDPSSVAAVDMYREAVREMKALPDADMRSWGSLSRIHRDFCPHHNWYFLPWHRAYLVALESIGSELLGEPNFAVPYWDWTAYRQLPPQFVQESHQGAENPLFHPSRRMGPNDTLTTVLMPFGVDAEQIFGQGNVDDIMSADSFQLFGSFKSQSQDSIDPSWQRVRGSGAKLEREPHDYAHGAVGGDMGDPRVSPNDPIFYLHHCNIDRLWDVWNKQGNPNEAETNWRDFVFVENFPLADGSASTDVVVSDMEVPENLGYVYDTGLGLVNISDGSRNALSPRPRTLLQQAFDQPAAVAAATDFSQLATAEFMALSQEVAFNRQRTQRIVAFVKGVTPPEDRGIGVRVFLNCSYLTPVTPVDDPHYAGSFTFFVGAEHSEHGGLSYAIDLTDTIRRLALEESLESDQLNVQLVPLTYDGRIYDGAIEIGEIEVVSI